MSTFEIVLMISLIILFVIMCVYYSKCKHKFIKILFGFCSGIVLLYPVKLILSSFGHIIDINIITISISAILGIPGVALIAALSFL
ncbi:pro-sigmaK processing inhibitor BofA family protein [Paludicola sp. MB14-C6]|uniref:pro-sigmaK processing inhibitor BofA family protein n=1 Tax=Paludihabitans sp. MB14-C6 TaxID=3070656 RepID=UPI0027DE6296|nr:pro-sigmaK processing inhibitor BofA family protein [Paludicola sp. MB14-C6]WMJ24425.1 pro-sigmaK processing inhibitor BofA family protein [Paludicola sp. MB14-C6]